MRKSGFYWVYLLEGDTATIGEYNSKFERWYLFGVEMCFKDKHFFFIVEDQIIK